MKNLFTILGLILAAICCIGTAAYMAINSRGEWGWFLVAGLMCASSLVIKNDDKDQSGQ